MADARNTPPFVRLPHTEATTQDQHDENNRYLNHLIESTPDVCVIVCTGDLSHTASGAATFYGSSTTILGNLAAGQTILWGALVGISSFTDITIAGGTGSNRRVGISAGGAGLHLNTSRAFGQPCAIGINQAVPDDADLDNGEVAFYFDPGSSALRAKYNNGGTFLDGPLGTLT